ncbi:MAG: ABC transporter substrate-binding protein, partial [Bacteroidia bacterium]|nr:ABC transporter substrate-binding protein [Bacteroidia bacterium]
MMPKRFLYCLLIPVLWACKESPQTTALYTPSDDSWEQVLYNGDLSDTVTVQIVSEPPSLHPTNARTSYRDQILGLVHQRLHILDVVTPGGIFPELALGAPVPINNGDSYSITIHPQATWPDGAPITADDVIFTIKAMACPLTDNRAQKAYFEYLTDVRAVEEDPKTVIFDFREYYMNNQNISVLSFILDPRKYDPDGVMAAYSIPDFLGEQA